MSIKSEASQRLSTHYQDGNNDLKEFEQELREEVKEDEDLQSNIQKLMNPKKQKQDELLLNKKFDKVHQDVKTALKNFKHDTDIELRKFK